MASVSQIYRTARLSYMSVFHRCSPYLIGLSLGHALRQPARHGKFFLTLGWLVSISLWGLVLWAGFDTGSTEYRYNISFAAQYAALAPVASAIALAWLIYVVHGGYCGFLSKMLSCRPLLIISRLSYAIYLVQFVVFFTNAATIKTSSEFTLLAMIDSKEISTILLSAVILTLTFVSPMQSLYRESPSESKEDDQNDESKENESNTDQDATESKGENEEESEEPPVRRPSFLAHREHLEEIPEVEVEYESQRDSNDGLEEIMEEEEDDSLHDHLEDDLEIIEEEQEQEQGGEDDYWAERREYVPRRSYSRNSDDRDLDEWEWTANGQGRNGAQYYRNSR